jgi:predicted ATPase
VAIRTPDQRLRVFVSSTLGELAAERHAVSRAITALRLTPVMFELGARPHPPRELYRAYLEQSDVFIGLYWQRYGWIGPGMQVSGLEEEFNLARGMPQLLYIKTPAPDQEPLLTSLLDRIRAEGTVSYRAFGTPAELARLVRDDLAMLLSERFADRTQSPPAGVREPRPLPASTTSLVGREDDVDEVVSLLERPEVRLVTLTGPGGIGKTRLAVAAAQRLRDHFPGRIAFVPLASVSDPGLLLASIGQAVGSGLTGTKSPAETLAEQLGDEQWLLILDNMEQLVSAAADLGELLTRSAGLEFLVTSRTVLGLAAEREYPVPPLSLPPDPASTTVGELTVAPAVELFVDRARRVRPDFALTPDNAGAVAEICRRLDGVPLAIELAAARTRLLDPAALLARLARSMDALGTGPVDMPERQRTLRATVEWSVGLLDDPERSLLEIVAIFADGWTIDAAARVAGLDEDRALELTEALARHSLIQLDHTDLGPRCRMLETVREFISERLANRADAAEIARRHADFYRALADRADRPLRAAQAETVERMDTEAGNVAAAVRWHLAHDPAPLPHLFRVLWPFWFLRGHPEEALVRQRVEQLLPIASSLGRQAEEELLWTAGVSASDLGDDQAAQSVRQRLEPLLPEIRDPFLSAVADLFMAWSTPITGDLEKALQEASACLDKLRGQDEPFFTSVAEFTASTIETALGHYDQALRHLSASRALADESGIRWLVAGTRVQLGILNVLRGKPDEARPVLAEALDLSLAARSTPWTTLSLAGHARLAFATGDARRAARLAGAAQGLRWRVGLQAWPIVRRSEAELVEQVRQALGGEQFDQAFADGSALSQREAVATARAAPTAAVLPAAEIGWPGGGALTGEGRGG